MDSSWQHNYDLGKKAFAENNYDTAISHLEKVALEKTNFADVYNMLGLMYYFKARFQDAVGAFGRAVEINPSYTDAALNLAVVYNELGELEKADAAYAVARQASVKNHGAPADPYAMGKLANMHADIGNVYRSLGMLGEASVEYVKALSVRPDFVDIRTNLGMVYRDMKIFESSIVELQKAMEQKPDYPAPRVQLGLTYYAMGQHEKARSEWLRVLKAHPDNKLAQMYMNLMLNHAG